MTSNIGWWWERQHAGPLCSQLHRVSYMDRLMENFSCLQDDEYPIEGEMGMQVPPFVAKFSTDLLNGNMLGVADEDGRVRLVDTEKTRTQSIIKEWSAHSNAVFDLAWIEKQAKMVTASGDQTARLWDIEKTKTIGNFRGHTRSLKSIDVQSASSYIFLTSARDGDVMVWDTRCNLRNGYHSPINVIRQAHERPPLDVGTPASQKKKRGRRQACQGDTKQSVTTAIFLNDVHIITSGACDGALKYWDIRKNYNSKGEARPQHVINFAGNGPRRHGFSSLVLNSTGSCVFAVCANSIIYEFSTVNFASSPKATYQGHYASSFYVKAAISPDDRFLICGSGDNSAYVWRTDAPNALPWVMGGHEREVMSVAWSPHDGSKIVTCSDDSSFKLWRLFQNTSDPSIVSGTVQRKKPSEDIETKKLNEHATATSNDDAPGVSGVPQGDCSEPTVAQKREKCFCKRLNYSTNPKLHVKWTKTVIHHVRDTLPKTTGLCSKQSSTVTSPYNVVTPDNIRCSTSTSLRERMKQTQGSGSKTPRAVTPHSAQRLIRTWFNSPDVRQSKATDGVKIETPVKAVKSDVASGSPANGSLLPTSDELKTPCSKKIEIGHTPIAPSSGCKLFDVTPPTSSKLLDATPSSNCKLLDKTPSSKCKLVDKTPSSKCKLVDKTPMSACEMLEKTPLSTNKLLGSASCSKPIRNSAFGEGTKCIGTPLSSSGVLVPSSILRKQTNKVVKHLNYEIAEKKSANDTDTPAESDAGESTETSKGNDVIKNSTAVEDSQPGRSRSISGLLPDKVECSSNSPAVNSNKPSSRKKSKKSAGKAGEGKVSGKSPSSAAYGNIKDMFLSMKHKADNSPSPLPNRKRVKLSEEAEKEPEDIALLKSCKENISPLSLDASICEGSTDERIKPVGGIQDVLDIAEDSTNASS